MAGSLHRRNFLKTSGAAAGAAALASIAAPAGAPATPPPAANPGYARLLPACCAYSYGKYLKDGKMTMEDFIVKAVELGVLGVEITTYWLKSADPAYLATLRRLTATQGMAVSGLAIGAQMCQPDAAKRREIVADIRKWVDATDHMGGQHLRVFGDILPPGATDAQGIGWVVETMKPAADYAGSKGITLGIETHMGLTTRAANVLDIIRRVDSPFAAINLDISNFKENPYEQIEMCLPRAIHTHVRDYWGDKKTPLDLDRVGQIFARHAFKAYMSAEYENDEDPMTGVPKLIEKIKTMCRKYSSA